jgi:hypothetical protein
MPTYVYKSLTSGERFEFAQSMQDPAFRRHPATGEPIQREIQAPSIRTGGLKRSTVVNKLSPAATACGCASNVALARQMYASSKNTPVYGSLESRKTVVSGIGEQKKNCGHGHGHGGGCGHKHG